MPVSQSSIFLLSDNCRAGTACCSMHSHPSWRSVIVIACSFAVIITTLVWRKRRNAASSKKSESPEEAKGTKQTENPKETEDNCRNSRQTHNHLEENNQVKKINYANNQIFGAKTQKETIPELPKPKWVKVGQVQELYMYPLKSGRGKDIRECFFSEYGICIQNKGHLALRDRMFLVYNEETRRFQTGRHYPTMILVSLSTVDEFKVKLEAVGMPSVVFNVPRDSKEKSEAVECTMWWGEPIKCIDCGPEPAEWLSRFLTGTNSGLKLGYTTMDKRNATVGPFAMFSKTYDKLRTEDGGLFSDLTSYMLMGSKSLEKLNEKLERPVPALQFRPNIVICGSDAFEEDTWEWIKIGERAIIRNVKPCPRCKMSKLDPETGSMDPEEPIKSLGSFREQTDPERIAVDGKAPLMGIYCGLYVTGKVKLGDDVFVHVPEDSSESNNVNAIAKSQPT